MTWSSQQMNSSVMERLGDLWMGGLTFEKREEGGIDCFNQISQLNRLSGLCFSIIISAIILIYGAKNGIRRPIHLTQENERNYYSTARLSLLVALSLIYGMQLSYKLARRAVIFMFTTCHVVSALWMVVLAMPPSRGHGHLREMLLYVWHGQVLPILFPTTTWLKLPFELELFWIQHWLIFLIPPCVLILDRKLYPLHGKGLVDWNYVFLAYALWALFHCFAMVLSLMTWANVAHMLCPASSEPFPPSFKYFATIIHQFLFIAFSSLLLRGLARLAAFIDHFRGDSEVNDVKGD